MPRMARLRRLPAPAGDDGDPLGHRPGPREDPCFDLEIVFIGGEELESAGDSDGNADNSLVGFDDKSIEHQRLVLHD